MIKYIYEVVPADGITFMSEQIKRTDEDGTIWWIPKDLANSDYQAYLTYINNLSNQAVEIDQPLE